MLQAHSLISSPEYDSVSHCHSSSPPHLPLPLLGLELQLVEVDWIRQRYSEDLLADAVIEILPVLETQEGAHRISTLLT